MGEARRRGSFEKRKRESIAREKTIAKKKHEAMLLKEKESPGLTVRRRRGRSMVMLSAMAAMSTATVIK